MQGRIGLAVSGGSDSMAMLVLAHAAIPGGFEVATVNHGIRPEAAAECALVEQACDARAIPCAILEVSPASGNLQHEAREARYRALAAWADRRGLGALATAHHADDQAETVLMRLNRGSGIDGLAGIRARLVRADLGVTLIRPLLGFRRDELAGVVDRAGLEVARDPSNNDRSFDRVRIRQALASADWLDPAALARSAAHLAQAHEALDAYAALIWHENVRQTRDNIRIRPGAPRAVMLRLLMRAIGELGEHEPRGGEVAMLLDRLEAGERANLAGVLATAEHGDWILSLEPPRRTG